jgi:hypothetical protein|tara:strand:- start:10373 stop:10738 length:366 start_codon:yes stop_codon:yes gene_type:complete
LSKNRLRSERYLKYIRQFPCLICGKVGVHAHHLRHAERLGWGRKNGDQWAVPLCAEHHMDCHRTGKESIWWATQGIDSIEWATDTYNEWHILDSQDEDNFISDKYQAINSDNADYFEQEDE